MSTNERLLWSVLLVFMAGWFPQIFSSFLSFSVSALRWQPHRGTFPEVSSIQPLLGSSSPSFPLSSSGWLPGCNFLKQPWVIGSLPPANSLFDWEGWLDFPVLCLIIWGPEAIDLSTFRVFYLWTFSFLWSLLENQSIIATGHLFLVTPY